MAYEISSIERLHKFPQLRYTLLYFDLKVDIDSLVPVIIFIQILK